MRASSAAVGVLQREVEVGHDRRRARASSTRAGRAPRSGRGRGAGRGARPSPGRAVSSRRSSGASEPGSPTSRPYQARSCATSTISATPPSTSWRASASIDSGVRERCLPRNDGIAQNAHARSQPSATFTYAHGTLGVARGSSRRSRTPVGLRRGASERHRRAERPLAREAHDGVDLGQRGCELVAVALGHAAGDHEARTRPGGRRRGRGRCRSTPGGPPRRTHRC